MHVALGNLHLTVALERRRPDRSATREPSRRDADVEAIYHHVQLRQQVEAARERWLRESLPPSWLR
jgi:hypothetical protein